MDKKYKLKATALSLLMVFSCGTMFLSLTVAWFTALRNANSNADGFKIGSTNLVKEVKFFQHLENKTILEDGTIEFFPTESSNEIGDGRYKTDLGFYNLLNNDYQTLMEITLTDEALDGGFSIDLLANTFATKSHLTANNTGKPEYQLSNKDGEVNSLSSIVDFYVFFQKDITFTNRSINVKIADNENEKDANGNIVRNFIGSNDDLVPSKSIKLVSFNAASIAENDVAKVYIMFDYNEENCAKMYGNNLGNNAIEEGHFLNSDGLPVLKFAADFEFDLVLTS